MIPRKQRILLMILIPLISIVVIGIIITILMLSTDFMKSNNELFAKYIAQNLDSINNIINFEEEQTYNNLTKENSYKILSDIKISNNEDENNQLNIHIEGQEDNTNNQSHKTIQFKQNDENLMKLDYINQDNIYAIKFSDFFKQYISLKNENLKSLASKMGIDENQIQSIPNSINLKNNIFQGIELSQEEKQQLYNKYLNLISTNITNEKYSKQKNALITVNSTSLNTNAYKVTLTKEQYNNIKIKLLEEIKQDEIILGKIATIEKNISSFGIDISNIIIKEEFIEQLENKIKEIQDNNIGTEQISITVYEYKGQLVRTTLESEDERVVIDRTMTQNSEKLSFETTKISENEESKKIEITKTNNNGENITSLDITNNKNGSIAQLLITMNVGKVDTTINKGYNLIYKNNNEEINIEVNNIINLGNVSITETLNDNNIILNDLDNSQINKLLNTVIEKVSPSFSNIFSEFINLIPDGIVTNGSDNNFLSDTTEQEVTDLQRNRFNSQFEIYAGEEIEGKDVIELINIVESSLKSINVENSKTLNISIERNKEDKELAQRILNVIKEEKKYNIELKYDNSTGLVSNIIITIVD